MLEKQLIEYCSPTLASLKTANLFTYQYTDENELTDSVREWNGQMAAKGIFLTVLRRKDHAALIYVCRYSKLAEDMRQPGTEAFLRQCGYEKMDLPSILEKLSKKLQSEEAFPHEIGLFLGYPLEDVVGFIVNAGRNYAFRGYWKVYTNVTETARMFEKYKKCKSVYERLWKEGRTVWQLTVAA